MSAPSSIDDVRAAVAELLGLGPGHALDDEANLVTLGLSSLQMMRISTRWRRAGTPVDFERLIAEPTVAGWARHVAACRQAAP